MDYSSEGSERTRSASGDAGNLNVLLHAVDTIKGDDCDDELRTPGGPQPVGEGDRLTNRLSKDGPRTTARYLRPVSANMKQAHRPHSGVSASLRTPSAEDRHPGFPMRRDYRSNVTPRNHREFIVEGLGVERLIKAAAEAAAAAAASGFNRREVSDSDVHICHPTSARGWHNRWQSGRVGGKGGPARKHTC
eukprot:jgi/Botrbrau1/11029/Bobra.92_2s0002.1